jgi:superoxide dismutase, Fe-Mn family
MARYLVLSVTGNTGHRKTGQEFVALLKFSGMSLKLPSLGYPYRALEPFIDEVTMKIHHRIHHAGYMKRFNDALSCNGLEGMEPGDIFAKISEFPLSVRNYGGGYFNHCFYWKIISPDGGGKPEGDLMDSIVKYFGTFENFREEFITEADEFFGSGWTWLIQRDDGELRISSTTNQDNPLMNITKIRGKPLLVIDLWEHAYHFQYKDKKMDYILAFWNIINWREVARLYTKSNIPASWTEP